MKQEDEQYFSAKMQKLADIFNEMVEFIDKNSNVDPENNPKTIEMRDAYSDLSDTTWEEFAKAGYNDEDWNNLMARSGAATRMGLE
jgi:hypothetical protein